MHPKVPEKSCPARSLMEGVGNKIVYGFEAINEKSVTKQLSHIAFRYLHKVSND